MEVMRQRLSYGRETRKNHEAKSLLIQDLTNKTNNNQKNKDKILYKNKMK
jgi:hypothetical protein